MVDGLFVVQDCINHRDLCRAVLDRHGTSWQTR